MVKINGDLTLPVGSFVNFDIGGTSTTQYGRVAVTGQVNFDGTLNINLVNSFNPALTDTFQLITYGSHTGVFTTSNLPTLDPGLDWNPQYNATDYTLSVIQN